MTEKQTLEQFPVVKSMAETYGVTTAALVHTVATMSMPPKFSREELLSCLMVAKEHGLNPLTKEIYFMRGKSKKLPDGSWQEGQIQPIIGVDGWIRKANNHPQFDGVDFENVYADNGQLLGMKCRIYRKDRGHPTEIYEDLAECAQAGGPVWKTSPHRMLRNRAFCQCARIAFGLSGVMAADEFQDWQQQGRPQPFDITPPMEPMIEGPAGPSPRDGGDVRSFGKRPAANAFADLGGKEFHEGVRDQILSAETIDELQAIYDEHCIEDKPWKRWPSGWANIIHHEYYCERMRVLKEDANYASDAAEDIEVIDPETGEVSSPMWPAKIIAGINTVEELDQLWQTLDENEREASSEVYLQRIEELS